MPAPEQSVNKIENQKERLEAIKELTFYQKRPRENIQKISVILATKRQAETQQLALDTLTRTSEAKIPEKKNTKTFVIEQTPGIPGLIEYHDDKNTPDEKTTNDRFSTPPPPPLKYNVPRVAILLPLSGPHARLGEALLNAAQLALFHFADKEFELIPQDTMGTPSGAADAATLAIADGASLILGPLFSSSANAITGATNAANLTVISFSNDRRVAGQNVFTIGFLPHEQVRRLIRFANNKGLKRFALLAPNNSYGEIIRGALEGIVQELGLETPIIAFYDPSAKDFGPRSPNAVIVRDLANYKHRRQDLLKQRKVLLGREDKIAKQALKRLKNQQTLGDLPFDALMVADGGERLRAIAALLPFYDIDPRKTRLLGTGLWDTPDMISEPALIGGWYAAPPFLERLDFMKNYEEMFGNGPPPRIATLAYDATALASVLLKTDGTFDRSEIMAAQGFGGRDGIFRFTNEGFAERGLSIYKVLERGAREIDKAPSNFNSFSN